MSWYGGYGGEDQRELEKCRLTPSVLHCKRTTRLALMTRSATNAGWRYDPVNRGSQWVGPRR
jgi:hypothetical protein